MSTIRISWRPVKLRCNRFNIDEAKVILRVLGIPHEP